MKIIFFYKEIELKAFSSRMDIFQNLLFKKSFLVNSVTVAGI